jgi:hypothetical protein
MSRPKSPEDVKLFASLLFSDAAILAPVLEALGGEYGSVDFISPSKPFIYTNYYCREMGETMERLFVAFTDLIRPESLPVVKLRTNEMEKEFAQRDGRRVNIDPGYLSPAHIILATGKGYAHRPYLRDGIYADLTLMYSNKTFQTLPWTYPDYGAPETREMFKMIRRKYMGQLRECAAVKTSRSKVG